MYGEILQKKLLGLLDPRCYPEGSYEIGCVRPSVFPSVQVFS